MGNCRCEYIRDNELRNICCDMNVENSTYSIPKVRSNPKPIENNIVKILDESNSKIKINLESKIPSFGKKIQKSELNALVSSKIINYIQTHSLNYQEYTNNKTYQYGPIQFKNGNIYSGSWNNECQMEGYGLFLIRNKNIVSDGIWSKGDIIYGRIFFPNDDMYEGDLHDSLPHGYGNLFFANGEIYKGEFFNGEIKGRGTYIYSDKTCFTGEIKNGTYEGKGSMKWGNGTEYHGTFSESTLSGKGKMFNNNLGEKYIGNFYKNEFHGKGIYTYKNGDYYDGDFEYGIKRGTGKFVINDKYIFDGIWDDDYPNGNGTLTYEDNKIEGFWRNGFIVGKPHIIEGKNENFVGVCLDIRPKKGALLPSSLPHLAINDTENDISTYEPEEKLGFI